MEAHLGGHGRGAGKWEIDGVLYNTLCNATEQEGLKKEKTAVLLECCSLIAMIHTPERGRGVLLLERCDLLLQLVRVRALHVKAFAPSLIELERGHGLDAARSLQGFEV